MSLKAHKVQKKQLCCTDNRRCFFPLAFLKAGSTTEQASVSTGTADDRGSCRVGLTWQTVDGLSGREKCCSDAPSTKSPRAMNSISVMFHSRFVTREQYLIAETNFPAALESARPQLRPAASSHLTLPFHHQAFYVRDLDMIQEKPDRKSPWTYTQWLHISPTHTQLTLKPIPIISICRTERCCFQFIWLFVCLLWGGALLSCKPASFLWD